MNDKEKVVMIPISSIDDFPNHPFEVRDDEEMELLANSISSNGVLNPVILRANGERFEIIAGHRRKYACAKIGVAEVPAIVREMTREEAIVEMVDSNLHREHILPSEKAKAYIEREEGGAYTALQYAQKLEKEIINLANETNI